MKQRSPLFWQQVEKGYAGKRHHVRNNQRPQTSQGQTQTNFFFVKSKNERAIIVSMLIFCVMLVCWQPDIKWLGSLAECVSSILWQRRNLYSTHTKKNCPYSHGKSKIPVITRFVQCAKAIQLDLSYKIWIQIQLLWVTVWTFGSALCSHFSEM